MTEAEINKLESKLDKLSEQIAKIYTAQSTSNQTIMSMQENHIDHESRIRLLEKWQNGLTPLFAAGTFILGCVATAVILRLMGAS